MNVRHIRQVLDIVSTVIVLGDVILKAKKDPSNLYVQLLKDLIKSGAIPAIIFGISELKTKGAPKPEELALVVKDVARHKGMELTLPESVGVITLLIESSPSVKAFFQGGRLVMYTCAVGICYRVLKDAFTYWDERSFVRAAMLADLHSGKNLKLNEEISKESEKLQTLNTKVKGDFETRKKGYKDLYNNVT